MKFQFLFISACLIFILGCGSDQTSTNTRFTEMQKTGIRFTNTVTGDADFNIFTYRNFYNGGGAAIGDINNDGLPDVFFTANMGANKLYLNKGNFEFEDISQKAQIEESDKWSTGVVFVDINNDGWLDIYVCNAGYKKGMPQENALFINNHDLTFTEQAAKYGLADAGYTTHAAFFDYDLDGDLDVYILNNSFIPVNTLNYANKRDLRAEDWPVADFLKGGGDKLFRNDNGHYSDVSQEAGIYGSLIGFGLGVTVGDLNNDSYPDIYISNDFFERDYLYINQQNGTFKELLEDQMQHISHSSMGADMGDVNNDGNMDVFVTEMLPDNDYRLKTTTTFEHIDVQRLKRKSGFYNQFLQNSLQINNGNGQFLETAFYSGVAASDWSWGGLIFDADNDGKTDIFVSNGIYQDVTDQDFIDFFANDVMQNMVLTGKKEEVSEIINKMPSRPIPNKIFHNQGNLRFIDKTQEWGLGNPSFSNGAAYGDLDNDGDMDLVINNVNQPASIYRNNSRQIDSASQFLQVELKGTDQNRFAIGARVLVHQPNQTLLRELIPSRGFQSSVDYKLHFGLGADPIDSVEVLWPNKTRSIFKKPATNQVLVAQQKEAGPTLPRHSPATMSSFSRREQTAFMRPIEDDYVDFYNERNIPQLLSRQGPAYAVGDVNGDGLDDLFVGGPSGQPANLYLQTRSGFTRSDTTLWNTYKAFEDVAALFFDADGDKDLDLLVGAGGNNQAVGSKLLALRLFLNDGSGKFTASPNDLPVNKANTSVIAAHDWDADGDVDLFIGSRSVPAQYGLPPASLLLENNGNGNFTDRTDELCVALKKLGMVTDAVWADVDEAPGLELVIVGEWMAPKIFRFENNRFTPLATSLSDHYGWWQSVKAVDMNNDGKPDLVLGNVGKNFYLQPTHENPVKCWIADFNDNGLREKVITRSINGIDVPVFTKKELTDQVPAIKKQNLRHEQFADKSFAELFGKKITEQITPLIFNEAASIIAWNNGNGNFSTQELPYQIQLSSVNAIAAEDLNSDGFPDLLLAGNNQSLIPQFGMLDASYGNVLMNSGNTQWSYHPSATTGFFFRGVVKAIARLNSGNTKQLILIANNDFPALYEILDDEKSKHRH